MGQDQSIPPSFVAVPKTVRPEETTRSSARAACRQAARTRRLRHQILASGTNLLRGRPFETHVKAESSIRRTASRRDSNLAQRTRQGLQNEWAHPAPRTMSQPTGQYCRKDRHACLLFTALKTKEPGLSIPWSPSGNYSHGLSTTLGAPGCRSGEKDDGVSARPPPARVSAPKRPIEHISLLALDFRLGA